MKFLKGWKTVLFNVGAAMVPAVLPGMITPEHLVTAVTVANLILRAVSTTPIGQKEPLSLPAPTTPLIRSEEEDEARWNRIMEVQRRNSKSIGSVVEEVSKDGTQGTAEETKRD